MFPLCVCIYHYPFFLSYSIVTFLWDCYAVWSSSIYHWSPGLRCTVNSTLIFNNYIIFFNYLLSSLNSFQLFVNTSQSKQIARKQVKNFTVRFSLYTCINLLCTCKRCICTSFAAFVTHRFFSKKHTPLFMAVLVQCKIIDRFKVVTQLCNIDE